MLNMVVDVTSKSAITSLVVDIASTNPTMAASLAEYGLSSSIDLCNAGAASGALKLMGLPVNDQVKGKTAVTYNITGQMKLLKELVGTHTFTVTVTDEQGGATTKALVITVQGEQVGPVAILKGLNIDERHTVVEGLSIDVVVSATSGIKNFTVQIVSDVLTPDQLGGVGLCDVLNLVEPTASYSTVDPTFDASGIAGSLTNFGFPTGDQVKDKTTVEFTITPFLSLLAFTGAGNHDFVMTITDNDGNTTVKTLMIKTL